MAPLKEGRRPSVTGKKYEIGANPSEWELKCQSWLDEDGVLYQKQGVACPPLKDFYMLWVTPNQVGFCVWEIKGPQHAQPGKGATLLTTDYAGFKTDSQIRGAIQSRATGEMDFLDQLVISGHINYLDRLAHDVQIRIISYLDVHSVIALAQSCSHFKKLCYSDDVWSGLFHRSSLKSFMTPGLLDLTKSQGWRLCYVMALRIMKTTLKPNTTQAQSGNRSSISGMSRKSMH